MINNETVELLLNLPDVKVLDFRVEKKRIEILCELKRADNVCRNCGKTCSTVNDTSERRLRDLNMADREVWLRLKVLQYVCKDCGTYRNESPVFADGGKSYTHRQSRFIFEICRKQTYVQTGAAVNMNAKTVERAVLRECEKRAAGSVEKGWEKVRRLGIDEQSRGKGKRNYFCVLTDLDTGTVIEMLENRKKETIKSFFEALDPQIRKRITDVSCDLYAGYISLADEFFPDANVVLDRFHVVKLLNEPLDAHRKEMRKKDKSNPVYAQLKYVLFKRHHLMTDAELDCLEAAFATDKTLEAEYFKRERFHGILDNNNDVSKALHEINAWIADVRTQGLSRFDGFLKTVERYGFKIANYVKDKVTNAATEGLNNLIRTVRRLSFGIPNFKHLRLRILALSDDFH